MDGLALLRLQIEWGADEAILDEPLRRLRPASAITQPTRSATTQPPRSAAPPVLASVPPSDAPRQHRPAIASGPAGIAAEIARIAAAATDIAALHAAIRDCRLCALSETATNPVLSAGPAGADVMIIGDPPGADEDRGGEVFSGAAGQTLNRILFALGLDQAALLLAPLIPWRPPGNRPPTDAEMAQCLPFLHRLILLAAPRHIMLLGAQAARALLPAGGNVTLRRVRGRWAELSLPDPAFPDRGQPIAALPTYHPATLRTANERREAWSDWRMLHRTINHK